MALATSHLLVGVAPSDSAAAASRLPRRGLLRSRAASPAPLAAARRICCRSVNSANVLGASSTTSDEAIPVPVVMIDQDSDRDATIVQLSFGDRLGPLLDTMKALKDLGLDVTKGTVATDSAVTQTKFHIMRFGRKVEDPDMLERIRLTIINNLLQYHPVDIDIATHVVVEDDGPKSMLYIETADRPGLLLEIIKIIADTNIDVESAEIDTEGLVAKDKFHVSYRGAKLNSSLSQNPDVQWRSLTTSGEAWQDSHTNLDAESTVQIGARTCIGGSARRCQRQRWPLES
ncbi:ACT domain containing protein [Panicum miliaceum]|uniref:ACT domain-containing protein ACR n=1 Tax=Panicum miliaceum TaxID=4540 RepID=A0A3L6PGY8_PANMI|nr:ACT domain containing protein [Panicum miliaceum]